MKGLSLDLGIIVDSKGGTGGNGARSPRPGTPPIPRNETISPIVSPAKHKNFLELINFSLTIVKLGKMIGQERNSAIYECEVFISKSNSKKYLEEFLASEQPKLLIVHKGNYVLFVESYPQCKPGYQARIFVKTRSTDEICEQMRTLSCLEALRLRTSLLSNRIPTLRGIYHVDGEELLISNGSMLEKLGAIHSIAITKVVAGQKISSVLRKPGAFSLDLSKIGYIFRKLLSILESLHANGIYHMNISMENIVIDWGNFAINLVGFENALVTSGHYDNFRTAHDRYFVTPKAPETLEVGRKYSPQYVDMWHLGVILFVISTRKYPFDNSKKGFEYKNGRYLLSNLQIPKGLPLILQTLLLWTLNPCPLSRPTANELLEFLSLNDTRGDVLVFCRDPF